MLLEDGRYSEVHHIDNGKCSGLKAGSQYW